MKRSGHNASDSALDSPVGEPSGDLLDMDQQARALAEYIGRNDRKLPFSLGIFGEWGEGKTTLVRLLHHHLAHPSGPGSEPIRLNFIFFSAWPYTTSEKLWRALILEIARDFYKREPDEKAGAGPAPAGETAERPGLLGSVSRFLSGDAVVLRPAPAEPDRYAEIVQELEETDYGQVSRRTGAMRVDEEVTMAAVVKGAVAALSTVSPLVAGLRGLFGIEPKVELADLLKKEANATAREKVEALPKFQEVFRKIIAGRPNPAQPVYIFVDDLDRAQPDVALDIMESIRVALWDVDCVFILAVDVRLISQGLRLRYKDLFAGEHAGAFAGKGQEYLEKIIQFSVRVPPRTQEQVQRLIAAEYPEWAAAGDIIQTVVGTNPRRVKQYCQRLTFQDMVGQRLFAFGRQEDGGGKDAEGNDADRDRMDLVLESLEESSRRPT